VRGSSGAPTNPSTGSNGLLTGGTASQGNINVIHSKLFEQ